MSPRKAILRELSQARDEGRRGTRPNAIRGFSDNASKYQSAVNDLLKAQLINGQKDDEGHLAISLNPHRVKDVKKELRPLYARPGLWAGLTMVGAITAFAVFF